MTTTANNAVVITAAGTSQRFGRKKEYLPFSAKDNSTVLSQSVYVFAASNVCRYIAVTVPAGEERQVLSSFQADTRLAPLLNSTIEILVVKGGNTRQSSVYAGLLALAKKEVDIQYVFVHDGARPWITAARVLSLYDDVCRYGAVVPAIAVTDTQKEINSSGKIIRHLTRSAIVAVQTPQVFLFNNLLTAHTAAASDTYIYTDDSEIYARYCAGVYISQGDRANKKITYPEDISDSEIPVLETSVPQQ
ncbi:MAG: IspD/TarI family cytidylyltransferase [Treponema sp.]